MADILINGYTYAGVASIKLPTVDGGEAVFTAAQPRVNSITTSGNYDKPIYHGAIHAAVDADGNLLLVVYGGSSTAYENIVFRATADTLPEGVELVQQSYNSYAESAAHKPYVAIFSGITGAVDIGLAFNAINTTNDYARCTVTITYAAAEAETT